MKAKQRWDLYVTITMDKEVIRREYNDLSSHQVLTTKAEIECEVPVSATVEFVKMKHRYPWEREEDGDSKSD